MSVQPDGDATRQPIVQFGSDNQHGGWGRAVLFLEAHAATALFGAAWFNEDDARRFERPFDGGDIGG